MTDDTTCAAGRSTVLLAYGPRGGIVSFRGGGQRPGHLLPGPDGDPW